MLRTLISLDLRDKTWLDEQARAQRVPMTELVRRAVRAYRHSTGAPQQSEFRRILARTSGIWRAGDGLSYQRAVRKEWRGR